MQGCKWHAIKIMANTSTKKFYGKVSYKTVDKENKVARGVMIQGWVTPNLNKELVVKEANGKKYARLFMTIQNQSNKLKNIADQLGATLKTYSKEDSTFDTLTVMLSGGFAEEFVEKVAIGDTVEIHGDIVPNTYNGETTLFMNNGSFWRNVTKERAQRKTADADVSNAPKAENNSAPHPAMNNSNDYDTLDIDPEDLPF